ncbi:MAG TPA: hypothetical protein VKH41_06755 [Myxococcota bacterium]|nr:hypothetical protein [Myxococcota bacterium]
MRTVPARLHVLLAREAATAVVIRRGPSRHVAVIGWDRATDTFEIGQWLCGRIYERRCDLSPDGVHLIYFAMNGRWRSRAKGSWTAISRAPYLEALTLLPKGDCWNGGGLFLSSRKYWVNGGACHGTLQDESRLTRVSDYPWSESYGGECPGVYYIRLQRDGWAMKSTGPERGDQVTLFEKRLSGHWRLRKRAYASVVRRQGRGCYFDEHQLWNARTEAATDLPDWEWADVDGERLVWAERGRLFAGEIGASGLANTRQLYDFNPLCFERLVAPY